MNEVEVARLIKTIIRYYPNFKFDDMEKTTNAWLLVLHDEDGSIVAKNLAEHVKTKVFPPVIADLLKVPERKIGARKPSPNLEETRMMLLKMEKDNENVATKEEAQQYSNKIKNILLSNKEDKHNEL